MTVPMMHGQSCLAEKNIECKTHEKYSSSYMITTLFSNRTVASTTASSSILLPILQYQIAVQFI
jgi:hypothetical protein